jgi:DNA polymerase-1
MTDSKNPLYVIDGHALAYRAYFAFVRNPLYTADGRNVSAIFGFSRMLLKLIQESKPAYLAVAFDPPRPSFRFKIYDQYKANRDKMPDELRTQVQEIRALVDELGIPRLENDEVEADDILGSMAQSFADREHPVYLVTGDKDAYQLVKDNVLVYANKKGISEFEIYDEEGIEKKTGLKPSQIIDYMALMGDSSDNIPGVKGIGEKTARSLLQQFGSLEAIYDNLDQVKGRTRDLLEEGREWALLSKELVTIRTDVDPGVNLDDLLFSGFNVEKARDYFRRLEMDSIIRDYFGEDEEPGPSGEPDSLSFEVIHDLDTLASVIKKIEKKGEVSIDTETTSQAAREARLIGISLSIEGKKGWYLPLVSEGLFGGDTPERGAALEMIGPLVEDPEIKKVGQNIKYDLIVLWNAGIEMKGVFFDTMVASYVLNTEERRHNLDDLASRYLGHATVTYKELVGTGKNRVEITDVPLERLAHYAVEDAEVTWRLYLLFRDRLREEGLEKLFYDLEMPLVPVLARMEYTGVKIDPAHFARLARENDERLEEVKKQIFDAAEMEFNINSTRELSGILFERLGLKPVKKTKTGHSTDISVLEALKGEHPIIGYLITYRGLAKLKSTYIDTLPKLVNPETGRIHTSYNQTVVATGRLSSSDPNLQNIPVRDEFGRAIRHGFVAGRGMRILAADYSQIELRLAAHVSGDENMKKAFREGIDIHNLTASRVFGVSLEEVEPFMRRQAKIINFATIYGVSPYGLSRQAEITMEEAAEFIRIYYETYPGFREYIDRTVEFAREKGYVETLMGRRRRIPEIASDVSFRREGAERVAINTPIQGSSADMIKIAMISIDRQLREKGMKSRMIMQVHDELVFEEDPAEEKELESLVRDSMEKALELTVPVVVDIGRGDNWEEAH